MWPFTVKTCAVSLHEHFFLQFCNDSAHAAWPLQPA